MKKYFHLHFELLFWIASLTTLAVMPMPENGFSFCPLHMLGIDFCPGCGLGKAIHLAFHCRFFESVKMHFLGIPAIVIIIGRIISIIKNKIKKTCLWQRIQTQS